MSEFFQRLKKFHKAIGQVQFVVFAKIYKCLFSEIVHLVKTTAYDQNNNI